MKCKETRSAPIAAGGEMILEGYPVVFESPTLIRSEIGDYVEIIHRGALDHCDLTDSRLLYNHQEGVPPLARAGKTMRLEVTDRGLRMVATLAEDNQTAREVYSAVKRGDLSGMSFSFVVPEGGDRFDGVTGTRHIDRVERIYEVSITPYPAYPQSSVEARDQMRAARDVAARAVMCRAARVAALIRADRIINHD